ncbi:MAG: type IV pilus modification PilV family protein [Syntrophomonadaceae bacterium]|jgi:prepilin-type N-terminal cleavage/methylation domain-containing protein|nr:prepilin-type N-terminal cleavage/methylation domain-containing protein [Syntrophomonadaceae bacterium]
MITSLYARTGSKLLRKNGTQAGVTLLEVLVSLVITLVLIGGAFNLFLFGVNNVSRGEGKTAACIYASSLLEEMKSRPQILSGVVDSGWVQADSMPFIQTHPSGVEAEINLKPLEGVDQLYIVNLKVLTTGGSHEWEEFMVGVVRVP